jgi:hypothetical protein
MSSFDKSQTRKKTKEKRKTAMTNKMTRITTKTLDTRSERAIIYFSGHRQRFKRRVGFGMEDQDLVSASAAAKQASVFTIWGRASFAAEAMVVLVSSGVF